jgi:uncharacterized protein
MRFDDLHVIELLKAIKEQYSLDWDGIHGISHWARVWENGMRLAEETGANKEVVGYFALFHDARRFNEGRDRDHGRRGADLAAQWRGDLFDLDDLLFELLYTACVHHTDGLIEADVSIQVCWDADRLDLGRVGIQPAAHRLCTEAAKEAIPWATERAQSFYFCEEMRQLWD